MTRFFDYRQNNSGGNFTEDHRRGISVNVIVEADSAKDADDRAQGIGLYFDGCSSGRDCSCCGDRWYSQSGWGSSGEEGDEVPSIYGEPIVIGGLHIEKGMSIKWADGPEGYVHYLDGTFKSFGLKAEKVRPPQALTPEWHGSKLYGTCSDCGKLVQINKKGLGSLHVCV